MGPAMDGTALGRITEMLRSTTARPGPGGDAAALAELADLIALTGFVEQLNERARLHLAPRPTVTSHLVQARNTSRACAAP